MAFHYPCWNAVILLLHGIFQCHLTWSTQYAAPLAKDYRIIAPDLRGHGLSDKPLDAEQYANSALWADDLHAVIDGLSLERPLIVAWSYAGYVVCDYLWKYGDGDLGGISFVAAAVKLTEDFQMLGPGFLDNFQDLISPVLEKQLQGSRSFLTACFNEPVDPEWLATAMGYNMLVPPLVRGAMAARVLNNEDVLGAIRVPTMVSIGMVDQVVLPSMGEYLAGCIDGASVSRYADTGHAPFVTRAERFNSELVAFAEEKPGA
jgi:pimeloyl-ACP methyl ester carboxylesterase